MDIQECLFGLVGEECHEIVIGASKVGQLANKINRFGPLAVDPSGQYRYDNVQEMVKEANDLIATIEMIGELNLPSVDVSKLNDREMIEAKKAKIRTYNRHSINLGKLKE